MSNTNGDIVVGKVAFPKELVVLRKKVNSAALGMTDFQFNFEIAYAVLKPLFGE